MPATQERRIMDLSEVDGCYSGEVESAEEVYV
jgi:hypothetical protein